MFKLSPLFLSKYKDKKPNWGFGALSEFVFMRTYARIKEDGTQESFFDVAKRVTEGVFNVQLNHCRSNKLPWNPYKAQKSAQEFFTRFWDFKWTPPGRGMWIMGTPIVDKIGGAALNNCLGPNTKVMTKFGMIPIWKLAGKTASVYTRRGWIDAQFKHYGKREVEYILLESNEMTHSVIATPDHKWVLEDGTFTESLRLGDVVMGLNADIQEYDEFAALDAKALELPPKDADYAYIATYIKEIVKHHGKENKDGTVTIDDYVEPRITSWLKENASYGGYAVKYIRVGIENNKVFYKVTLTKEAPRFKVVKILPNQPVDVYCAEVPDENAFTIDGGMYTGNCGFRSTEDIAIDFAAPFCWTMDMLMLGVGVGFDTKGALLVDIKESKGTVDYQIPDSREGWVESLELKLKSYVGGPKPNFDYSLIRKAGEPIRGFGGVASGPEPLKQLHKSIDEILAPLIGNKITSVAIVDIMNFIGKCVVAGNVRRSAMIAIGDMDDEPYVTMKDWTKYASELADRRWASNNSVFSNIHSDFNKVAPSINLNGEPGLIFLDNMRHYGRFKDGFHSKYSDGYDNVRGVNPCGEQQLENKELCCLVETYPAHHDSPEDFYRTLKFAYLYAKTVTLIPTHDEGTNAVMMRNRRIGCSMSGIQQAIKKFGLRKFIDDYCDKGYEVINRLDRKYSRWLGVPRSIRKTSIKPSGSISLLTGATPGIHCTHSEYYIRAVRCPASNKMVDRFIDAGYIVEFNLSGRDLDVLAELLLKNDYTKGLNLNSIDEVKEWAKTNFRDASKDRILLELFKKENGTVVIYFPVKEKNFTKSKFDISIWEQMALVREMQHYWSDNSVSCTVTIRDNEKDDLANVIEFYAPYVKALSFLPLQEHNYDQAPYREITKEEYDEYSESLLPIDFTNLSEGIEGSKFCTNDSCSI